MKRNILLLLLLSVSLLSAQATFNPDTVKAQKFDTGKMWTFEYPPFEYLKQTYNFTPSQEWFDDVRLSSLRIPGCSASFVSSDGLIMTNNHCVAGPSVRDRVQKPGEDLEKTGFYAVNLEDERKIPNYFAEQLIVVKDITSEVLSAMKEGKTEKEKIEKQNAKIVELKTKYAKELNLKTDIISYYNGSIFFLQGFKVYNDVRYVFEPEEQIASFGGDPDNFVFPRFGLDCAFLRIYDNGKPLKTDRYFKWSEKGASTGELVFTVGNPGTTNRLRTVAQLEYARDIQFRNNAFVFDGLYKKIDKLKAAYPARANELESFRVGFSNGWKSIVSTYNELQKPYLFARKKDFENKIKEIVFKDAGLKKEYGHVWKTIETTRKELRTINTRLAAYIPHGFLGSIYTGTAYALVRKAKQTLTPPPAGTRLQQAPLFPKEIDSALELAKLELEIDYIELNIGKSDPLYKKYFEGKTGTEIAKNLIEKSLFKNKQAVDDIAQKDPKEILKLNDPFIQYYAQLYEKTEDLKKKQTEVNSTENIAFGLLGKIMYKIYGTTIPPDANRTLRIGDGVIASYNYNGTVASTKTTFHGLYDRAYGNDLKYPFNLPARWMNIPLNFDLTTPLNLISTNDTVGGSSGSPLINKNAEIVGILFDGNIESLSGDFIYLTDTNRSVSVDSRGMYESLKKVYKADRIADELKSGNMVK